MLSPTRVPLQTVLYAYIRSAGRLLGRAGRDTTSTDIWAEASGTQPPGLRFYPFRSKRRSQQDAGPGGTRFRLTTGMRNGVIGIMLSRPRCSRAVG